MYLRLRILGECKDCSRFHNSALLRLFKTLGDTNCFGPTRGQRKNKDERVGHFDFSNSGMLRYEEIIFCKDDSVFSLYLFGYLVIKKKCKRPDLVKLLEVPKMIWNLSGDFN